MTEIAADSARRRKWPSITSAMKATRYRVRGGAEEATQRHGGGIDTQLQENCTASGSWLRVD
jgi:hypothetical protein